MTYFISFFTENDWTTLIYCVNLIIALTIIFLERKNPAATLAWILVLYVLPILGIFLYLMLSQNISRQKIYRLSEHEKRVMGEELREQTADMEAGRFLFENETAKHKLFYISDEQFFFPSATPLDMKRFYQTIYPEFDGMRFLQMLEKFELSGSRKINSFSKGMKKQISILLGICSHTPYLLCDETFDGLDPVMRQAVKSIFVKEMEERSFTPIIASHNLRELEDICDHIGLLHKGGILLSKDLEDMKLNIHKLQCVFQTEEALIMYFKNQGVNEA